MPLIHAKVSESSMHIPDIRDTVSFKKTSWTWEILEQKWKSLICLDLNCPAPQQHSATKKKCKHRAKQIAHESCCHWQEWDVYWSQKNKPLGEAVPLRWQKLLRYLQTQDICWKMAMTVWEEELPWLLPWRKPCIASSTYHKSYMGENSLLNAFSVENVYVWSRIQKCFSF